MLSLKTSGSFSAEYNRESALLAIARAFPKLEHAKVLELVSGKSFIVAQSDDRKRLEKLQNLFSSFGVETKVSGDDEEQSVDVTVGRTCESCGAQALITGAQFCSICGAKLGPLMSTTQVVNARALESSFQAPPTSSSLTLVPEESSPEAVTAAKAAPDKSDAINGLRFIAFVAVAAFLLWHHFRSGSTQVQPASSTSVTSSAQPAVPAIADSNKHSVPQSIAPSSTLPVAPSKDGSQVSQFMKTVGTVLAVSAALIAFIVATRIPPLFYSQWDRYRTSRISIMFWQLVAGSVAAFFAFSFVLISFGIRSESAVPEPIQHPSQTVAIAGHPPQVQAMHPTQSIGRNLQARNPSLATVGQSTSNPSPKTFTAEEVGDDDTAQTSDALSLPPSSPQ